VFESELIVLISYQLFMYFELMQVVTEPTPLPGNNGLVGVNSFGFGGANCHVLLEWNKKVKANKSAPAHNIPRIVAVSGRTWDAVNYFLDGVSVLSF